MEPGRGPSATARVSQLTAAVLLLTPFVVFLRHHAYSLGEPEALALSAALAAAGAGAATLVRRSPTLTAVLVAGLAALFIDVQFDLEVPIPGLGETGLLVALTAALALVIRAMGGAALTLVLVMTSVVLLSTFLLAAGRLQQAEGSDQAGGDARLPLLLHLILDEHIGVEGLRTEGTGQVGPQIRAFLDDNRFLVYGGAYAEFAETVESIGHVLDLAPGRHEHDLLESSPGFAARLTRSRYFEWLSKQGYAIHVSQADHLDMCHSTTPVASCDTYASTRLGVLEPVELPASQKAQVIAGAYLSRSDIWNELRERYHWLRGLLPTGLGLPEWAWERTRVSPIATSAALDRLAERLRRARPGQAIVAHLLLPHYPYVYDAECRIRPPDDWLDRNDPLLPDANNTPGGRALRYERYGEQVRCTQRRVQELLDAIPAGVGEQAIVILQGDHGSRISLVGRRSRAQQQLIPTDYMDAYSTLFAIRAPGLGPRYDQRQASAACLLEALVESRFQPPAAACEAPPAIQWQTADGTYVSRALPAFSEAP